MRKPLTIVLFAVMAGLLISCKGVKHEGRIIAVELLNGTESPEGGRLVMFDPDRPEKAVTVLTESFSGAAAPSLSHEGRYLYFQGKKQPEEPWQIWVMDLRNGKVRQVVRLEENCTHPASLPDGSVVFAREGFLRGKEVLNLWKCGMDGCCLTQLTHHPGRNTLASVLREGRILYSSQQIYPGAGEPQLMIMRPDGTKSELYTPGGEGVMPRSGGKDSPDGYIYFIGEGGRLCRVRHKRPLHTFEILTEDRDGRFLSVFPRQDSTLLVSYLPVSGELPGIYRLDTETATPEPLITGKRPLVDPLRISAIDPRPKILPSPVDPGNPTALLMTQNINHSMLPVHDGIAGDSVADRVRITTLNGEWELVEAKDDGSVYVKMNADTPFRLEALNPQGEVVRGPSDWIYLRPNERRACTGCHADPELAPRNYQPHAVKEEPVLLTSLAKGNHL